MREAIKLLEKEIDGINETEFFFTLKQTNENILGWINSKREQITQIKEAIKVLKETAG